MSDTASALQWGIESALSDVNTALPATVVSYDPQTNRAVVKASFAKRLADGSELEAPAIHEVPVAFQAGGGASFTFPLKPGDGALLIFSQRSLEGWLSGDSAAPDDPRRFALSDAVAIPGLRSTGVVVDPAAAVVAWAEGKSLRLEEDGTARLKATKLIVENDVQVNGKINATGDVVAGTVSLQQHRHIQTQPGTGVSGIPSP